MDNAHVACSTMGGLWPSNPEASAVVWFVAGEIPLDEGAGVVDVVVRKSKEKVNPSNEECFHPNSLRVTHVNEDTVPTWSGDVAPGPARCGVDDLTVHSSGARRIARRTKCRCGGMVDRHLWLP
jgi:hypothetical protein